MKNNYLIRLALVVFAACSVAYTNAQTIFFQNFEASKTVIPTGWSQEKTTIDGGWEFNDKYGTNMGDYVPTHTYCAFVDDWDNNTSDKAGWDTLYTPSMNCSAYSKIYLSLDYMYWMDDGNETGTIAVSIDGGHTWTTAINLVSTNGVWADSSLFDLSTYVAGQANVMLAFTYYNGYATTTNGYVSVGMCIDNIDVYVPVTYSAGVTQINGNYLMQVGTPYTFTGTVNNYGSDSIVSMNLNYTVNGGTAQVDNITGISNFNGLTTYNYSHSIPFTPSAPGSYVIKMWPDHLNGTNPNQDMSDTMTAYFMAVDSVQPRSVLYEEGTGQSCVYCMLAGPNLDTVLQTVHPYCNVISYHVPIPSSPDYMYSVTSPTTDTRANYYGVYTNGTPDGFMDGWNNLYPGALAAPDDFSTPMIAQEAAIGSPFKITFTNCTYNTTLNQFSVSANITSYGTFAAGLTAQVAIVADSITYGLDYSADDPTASFAPPIGTGASGYSYTDAPDYLYPYVLKFPHVAEQMLPNGNGTSLAAFTPGSTQTLNLTWTKNHPFSYELSNYPYDSSTTNHVVVFIQSNSGIAAAGVPAKYVFQSANSLVTNFVGIDELSHEIAFNMYPNPTSGNTTIEYDLQQEQNVSIAVYNLLGEQVYTVNPGTVAAGHHTVMLSNANLSSGVYMVRLTAGTASSIQRLIIQQ